jgi:hypothetical protein
VYRCLSWEQQEQQQTRCGKGEKGKGKGKGKVKRNIYHNHKGQQGSSKPTTARTEEQRPKGKGSDIEEFKPRANCKQAGRVATRMKWQARKWGIMRERGEKMASFTSQGSSADSRREDIDTAHSRSINERAAGCCMWPTVTIIDIAYPC